MQTADHRQYESMLPAERLAEGLGLEIPRVMPEADLQARWFSGEFGRNFTTLEGETVRIVQFGIWNHEPGPDFIHAAVQFGDGEVFQGAIEIDPEGEDWERHGHSGNPAFDGVVLHVFPRMGKRKFFTRTTQHRAVPQVLLTGHELEKSTPGEVLPANPGRCSGPLAKLDESAARSVVEAAAVYRLRRKADRLAAVIAAHGQPEALYQGVATALGYKQNKLPFLLLAQRVPVASLRRAPAVEIQAAFFGVAGFIDAREPEIHDDAARAWLRELWASWWKRRSSAMRLILDPSDWQLGGMRPANHPQRRIAALAVLVSRWKEFVELLDAGDVKGIWKFLENLDDDFWSCHYTLKSRPSKSRMALIGKTRVGEIFANVLFPLMHHRGLDYLPAYQKIRATLTNRVVETAAMRLLADSSPHRKLADRLINQQGLLQIYEDFCLQDCSDCAQCSFPERVLRWEPGQ